jgi:small nuclear ribonucleoprotein (snRNP)-like protein
LGPISSEVGPTDFVRNAMGKDLWVVLTDGHSGKGTPSDGIERA